MRILIVGAERVGQLLATNLLHAGHDVHVLDPAREDPLDRDTLTRAAEGCDALACVSEDDNLNVVVALAARRELRLPLAVAAVANPRRADALTGLGAHIFCPTTRSAHSLHLALIRSGVETELTLGSGVGVYRVELPPRLAGRSLSELERRGKVLAVAVERRSEVILAAPDLVWEQGDAVHLVASHRDLVSELTKP
jgi:trk system potassium uptake protein